MMFRRKPKMTDAQLKEKSPKPEETTAKNEPENTSFSEYASIFGTKNEELVVSDDSEVKSDSKSKHEMDPIIQQFLTEENDTDVPPQPDLPRPSTSKSVSLIQEVQKLNDKRIKPFVDYNEGRLFYPILSKIGESQDNVSYLDGLVSDGILEKKVYEKLVVCPLHPDTFSSSVRLYCPKCHSMSVEKLNLFEHKKCGFITESSNFDFSDESNSNCPSCKKEIKNFDKEIRVPAMWYQCNDCSEKFDNAVVKLHCRKHEHDFDTNSGQFVTTYSYALKNSELSVNSDTSQIKDELHNLLQGFNFNAKLNVSLKGKSGNVHDVPIYAKSKNKNESILIFIKNHTDGIDQSELNSVLVPKLDIDPTHTLLVTTSGIADGVDNLAKHYGINLISEANFPQTISRVEEFVSEWYSKNGGKK